MVKATQATKNVPSDQERDRRHPGDLPDDVVLLKVELSRVESGVWLAEGIRGRSHRLKLVFTLEDLGTSKGGVVANRLSEQSREGIRSGAGVAVKPPNKSDSGVEGTDDLVGAPDRGGTLWNLAGSDDQHLCRDINLLADRSQGFVQVGCSSRNDNSSHGGQSPKPFWWRERPECPANCS